LYWTFKGGVSITPGRKKVSQIAEGEICKQKNTPKTKEKKKTTFTRILTKQGDDGDRKREYNSLGGKGELPGARREEGKGLLAEEGSKKPKEE